MEYTYTLQKDTNLYLRDKYEGIDFMTLILETNFKNI